MEITRWKISTSIGSVQRVEVIKLDKKLVRSLDFHTMESDFLIPDYMGEHRFWEVDNSGKPIKSNGKILSETVNEETSRPALAQAWRSFIDYNPDNGVLVMATQLGEALEIYNLKDSTHKVLYGPEGEPIFQTGKDGSGIPNEIMGFSNIKVTNKHIYAVFQGIKFKDKLAAYQQGEQPEDGARFIYVFDLEGNPELSDLALANVEALANGESGGSFGCGDNAAYEWDSDWYEDTKNFTKCRRGCPEGSGTQPKYMNC